MRMEQIQFRVTALHATVPEGVVIVWRRKEVLSGPLTITLHQDAPGAESRGELDYARRHARAEFHVRVEMPDFTDLLQTLGVNPALTLPVVAVVRSEGDILDDHSFKLTGACRVDPHALFGDVQVGLLPGH